MSDIDYRALLVRYMDLLLLEEGVTHCKAACEPEFSAEEQVALQACEVEALRLFKSRDVK